MAADADALAKKLALSGSELRFLLVHHKVSDEIHAVRAIPERYRQHR